jgi:outer membrane protein
MMKKAIIAASLAAILSTGVQADTLLGLYIGGHMWANEATGSFGEKDSGGEVNQASFNFDDESQGSYFIALEHPIPLIPNVKISSTTLDTVGTGTFSGSFIFEGVPYDENTSLDTTFDASYVDYTLYYELLDNDLLTFDFGITARDLDTQINVVGNVGGIQESTDLSGSAIVPLLYINTIIGLPFTGFNIFAEGNFLSYGGSSIYDYQVGVSYALLDNIAVDLDVNLGYRTVGLELDDIDNLYSDLTFEGVFLGATVHF